VREIFQEGGGTPALLAVYQDATGKAKELALAYAKGIGCTRAGVIETTFAEETKQEMWRILREVQDGTHARNWILENMAGRPFFNAMRKKEREHPMEEVGRKLRRMMPWLPPVEV